jgi:6-pyruvoyltetrahydropterin/6-carboxytetrahydropterin synthase
LSSSGAIGGDRSSFFGLVVGRAPSGVRSGKESSRLVDPKNGLTYGLGVEIFKEFTFEAAHRLPNVPPDHKCSRLHGHSFQVAVHLSGQVDDHSGWVCDFGDISRAMAPLLEVLDHYYLNEIDGLENPTSEVLARWVWERLRGTLPGLSQIVVRETCNSGCAYRGEAEG